MAKLLSNTRVYGTATVDTRLFVNGTTAVHSTNSGALQVGGGIGVAGGGFFAGTVTATNFVGSVSGASASLNGGTAGQIPYQVSPGVTSFFGPGAVGELLVGNGTSIPLFASTTTIYVGNAVTATNVRGGAADQFIYQTAPGITAFINTGSMYVGNAVTATNVRGGATGEFIYQSAPGVTAFINTSSMYVGRAAVADTVTGGGSTVQTAAQVGNAAYYLTFVDSNNAVATAELVYTTSSFVVNASTGNVGLGTTSPSEKLELSGAADAARIKLTNSALGRSSILGHGSNGFYWQPTNNGDLFELRDSAATGHVAFNPNTTNFGIGTTGPTTKLHVAGAAGDTRIRVSANDGTNYRGFEVFAGATQKGGMYYRTTEGNVLQIWGPNTGIGAIYIDSNNVVDINSNSSVHSTATGALHVIGGLGVGGGGFFGGTVTATNFVGAFTGAAGQIETRQATANSSHFLTFVDSNNVSATAEIVYTTSSVTVNPGTGFVGIGTASPSYRLQIDTTSEWGVVQRYANDTTTNRGTVYLGLRGRGSLGSPTVPTSGTILAGLAGGGWNGSAYTLGWNGGAEILLQASETWTGSAAGSEILFRTTPLGSATPQNRMFIAENGRVGIGTTSPTNNLTVSGSSNQSIRIHALDGGGSAELDLLSNGVQNAFVDFGPNDLRFRSTNADMSAINNQSVLVLANGGSVITGGTSAFTTGGTAKLTIVDSSVALSVGASNSDLMYVRRLSGGNYQFQTSTSSPGDNTGNIHIQPYGGNVGVGTTTPPNKFSVNSTSAPLASQVQISHPGGDWGLIIKRNADDTGNSNFAFVKSRGEAAAQIVQGDAIGRIAWHAVTNTVGGATQQLAEIGVTNTTFASNDADAYMFFSTKAAGDSLTERVRITPAGNFGINITPTNRFHVSGDAKFGFTNTGLRFYESGDDARLDFVKASNDTVSARFEWNGYTSSTIHKIDYFGIYLNDTSAVLTSRFHILENGNVGLTNTSPSFRLDITGTARATADFRAPIFYDSDNTNFYADPASTSIFNILQVTGYVRQQTDGGTFLASDVSENNNWLFQENARGWGIFYLNKGSQSGQTFGTYTTVGAETFFIGQNAGTTMPSAWTGYNASSRVAAMISNYSGDIWAAGRIYSANSLMAPTFIDSDDQNFFVNPAGSSTVNNITISGNKTFARFNSAYVFVRGTGLNNNANRYVAIDGTERVNDTARGLTLTIINAATLAHVSSTNYDTYGDAAASTALGTAITNMTSAQIGILTSYDAWELAVNDALRNAARKVGLSKLANYSAGGSRRPYAAIFYGTSDDPNASTKDTIERMESDDADAPRALITTYITSDGAQAAIDGAYSVNVLYSSNSTIEDPVVIVNSSGFVGIGTNSPDEELVVSGSSYPVVKIQGSQQPSLFLASDGGSAEIYNAYGTLGILYQGFTPSNSSQLFYFAGNGIAYANSQLQLFDSKMVITGGGNVGIGDTTPSQRLVVSGRAVVTSGILGAETGAPDAPIWAVSGDYLNWGIFYNEGTPDYIEFQTGGTVTSRIALDTGAAHFGISGGGYVGIATGSPVTLLDISHNGASTYGVATRIHQSAIGNSDGPKIEFRKTMTSSKSWGIGMLNGVNVGSFVIAEDTQHNVGFGTTRLQIDAGGAMYKNGVTIPFVSIGDNAPTATQPGDLWWESDTGKLKIRYNDGTSSNWVDAVAVPDTALFFPKAGGAITGPVVMNSTLTVGGTLKVDNKITVGSFPQSTTNNNEAWFGRAADRSVGQMTVQLGQANSRTFEVVDWQWTTVIFAAGMDSLTYRGRTIPTISLQDSSPSGVKDGDLWWESDTGKLKVRYNDGSSTQWVDAMPIPDMSTYFSKGGGGIYGSVAIDGTLTVSGKIFATDTITANYSDARLKNVSGKITDALDKLSKISGYYYTANEVAAQYGYDTKKESVGVLAQEIEQVMPQAVTRAAFDTEILESGEEVSKTGEEYKTVYYERLVPLLIEAIKEQQTQIDKLTEKVKKLEGLN